jgi:hypothetical protein
MLETEFVADWHWRIPEPAIVEGRPCVLYVNASVELGESSSVREYIVYKFRPPLVILKYSVRGIDGVAGGSTITVEFLSTLMPQPCVLSDEYSCIFWLIITRILLVELDGVIVAVKPVST